MGNCFCNNRKIKRCAKSLFTLIFMYILTGIVIVGISFCVFVFGIPGNAAKGMITAVYCVIGYGGGIFYRKNIFGNYIIIGQKHIKSKCLGLFLYLITWLIITLNINCGNKNIGHIIIVCVLVSGSYFTGCKLRGSY